MLQLVASIGSFLPGLFGKTLSYGAAKIVGFIILAVVLIGVLGLGKCAYDASVINAHESKDKAEKAQRQLEADRKADEVISNKAAAFDESQRNISEAGEAAKRADPIGAASPVGPVSQSYYDNLPKKEKH